MAASVGGDSSRYLGCILCQGMDVAKPTAVIASGPYGLTRNPMYLAWALVNLGIGLVANNRWVIVFLPGAIAFTHLFTIPQEERFLGSCFGQAYLDYKSRVGRWL